jgi:hypothetical protein
MKQSDESIIKSDPHESQKSKSNRLETPEDLFYSTVWYLRKLGITPPTLDVFASKENSRCLDCITAQQDAFSTDFTLPDGSLPETVWCNAPHDIYKQVIPRLYQQYLKHDFNVITLIPSTNMRTNYWHEYVEPNKMFTHDNGFAYYYPVRGAVYFTLDQQFLLDIKGRKSHAHNGYLILLFVKKSNIKNFKEKLLRVDYL